MNSILIKVVIATGLLGTALGLLFPVTPFFAQNLGADIDTVAMLFSVYSLCAMVSAPLWGFFADRFGRKTVLLLGAGAGALCYLWMANATFLWELFAARILAGIFSGWMVSSQALISDISSESNRIARLGILGATFGIGITIGPASSAVLMTFAAFSFTNIYILSSFLCLLALAITFSVPDHHQKPATKPKILITANQLLSLHRQKPLILSLLVLAFFLSTSFTIVEGIFALWTKNEFSLTPAGVGYLLTAAGLIAVVLQGGVVGILVRKIGSIATLAIAAAIMAIGAFLLMIAVHLVVVVVGLFFLSAGFALLGPPLQGCLIAQNSEHKATLLGLNHGIGSLARVIGPTLGGLMFVHFNAYAPFATCLGLTIFALILWFSKIRLFAFSNDPSNQDAS